MQVFGRVEGAPAMDSSDNIYVETGNGLFDANTGGIDFGDTFLKLGTVLGSHVADYFTPPIRHFLRVKTTILAHAVQ